MSQYRPPGYPPKPYAPPPGFQPKPGKVQAIAVLTLIGGIYAIVYTVSIIIAVLAATICLGAIYLPMYFGLVAGIMATIKGAQLLGRNDRAVSPPFAEGVMLIINIVNCDVVSLVLGIIIVVFAGDQEVKAYYSGYVSY